MPHRFLRYIKFVIITLNRYYLFKMFFIFLYKIQLKLIVAVFKHQKGVSAIILRRKNVLKDVYPGDSDYDITCVITPDIHEIEEILQGCRKRHRYLNIICPALGETHFVIEKDLSAYFGYNFINYYDSYQSLYFLYKKNSFPASIPKPRSLICVYQMIYWTLIHYVWSELFTSDNYNTDNKATFNRQLCKNVYKIKWLVNFLNTQQITELNYMDMPQKKENFRYSQAQQYNIAMECLDIIKNKVPFKSNSKNFSFKIDGSDELLPQGLLDDMHNILSEIILGFDGFFEEIVLCNYGLYKTDKILLLKANKGIELKNNHNLYAAIRKCARNLQPYYIYLTVNYPIPLDSTTWESMMQVDPILKTLYECEHYDFIKGEKTHCFSNRAVIPREVIYMHIAELIHFFPTVMVRYDLLQLLEALFGQLIPYNLLLERGIFYTSFGQLRKKYLNQLNLNQTQKMIIDIYQQGNLSRLKKTNPSWASRIFRDEIICEINKARALLKNAKIPYSNS